MPEQDELTPDIGVDYTHLRDLLDAFKRTSDLVYQSTVLEVWL